MYLCLFVGLFVFVRKYVFCVYAPVCVLSRCSDLKHHSVCVCAYVCVYVCTFQVFTFAAPVNMARREVPLEPKRVATPFCRLKEEGSELDDIIDMFKRREPQVFCIISVASLIDIALYSRIM